MSVNKQVSMSNEKENPNDAKPKIIPFDKWVKSLELKKTEVPCEVCDGEGIYECDECCGDGTVKCEECWGSGLTGGCFWCDDEGGYYDEYPGIESTGWVVCEYCHGHPLQKCDCKNGKAECWNDGCFFGEIECDECGGSGDVTLYSPKDEDHMGELVDLGVFLFSGDGSCDYDDLRSAYKQERAREDRLMAERGKMGDLEVWGALR
jgi:hypothetical protein